MKKLSLSIIYDNSIKDNLYINIIKSLPYYWYPDLSDLKLSKEKLKSLLAAKIFKLTANNHNFLKTNLPEFSYELIEKNYSEYSKDPTIVMLENQEYKSLINSVYLKNAEKISIVKSIPEDFYEGDIELTKEVCGFVVQNTTEKVFSIELVEKLLGLPIDFELKVKLFNTYAKDFESSKIKTIVSKMDVISGLTKNKRPRIANNIDTLALVMFLSLHHYLSYKQEKEQLKLIPKGKILN